MKRSADGSQFVARGKVQDCFEDEFKAFDEINGQTTTTTTTTASLAAKSTSTKTGPGMCIM